MVQAEQAPLQVIELGLDRSLQNHEFDSWKLLCSSAQSPLTQICSPVVGPGTAVDYIRTRAALLHNHLHHSCGRIFVFTCPSTSANSNNEAAELHELTQAGVHQALTILDLTKLSGDPLCGKALSVDQDTCSSFDQKTHIIESSCHTSLVCTFPQCCQPWTHTMWVLR